MPLWRVWAGVLLRAISLPSLTESTYTSGIFSGAIVFFFGQRLKGIRVL